jgi:hypothetical protein
MLSGQASESVANGILVIGTMSKDGPEFRLHLNALKQGATAVRDRQVTKSNLFRNEVEHRPKNPVANVTVGPLDSERV